MTDNSQKDAQMGYRGELRNRLQQEGLSIWDLVKVTRGTANYEGVILPRPDHTAEGYLVLKTLDTYYNIGIKISAECSFEKLGRREGHYQMPEREVIFPPNLPKVTLLGTGGTIASRLDYRTGAVLPAFTAQELFSAVPELISIAELTPKVIFQILSENFDPKKWVATAEAVGKELESGQDGVVIGHGTDTMAYTGSFLSFAMRNLHAPVVLVGSQRSSDRPSSDGPINIQHATKVAGTADLAEVVLCMHGGTSDSGPGSNGFDLLHYATRVRKQHSSRRDAFRTIGDTPLAVCKQGNIEFIRDDYRKRSDPADFYVDAKFDDKVTMLYSHPGLRPEVLDMLIDHDYHGIVLIGTGLGHCGTDMFPALERAQEQEIPIAVVVQPLYGYTNLRVYETGRDMLARGVIECKNMIPEAAFAKLVWVLGHTRSIEETRQIMETPIAHEITPSEPEKGYLVFQGVEQHINKVLENL